MLDMRNLKELTKKDKYFFPWRVLKKGNIKLGNMWTFSSLMGSKKYDMTSIGLGELFGSCGKYCEGCEMACYVRKSYRYPSVVIGHARTSYMMTSDIYMMFHDIVLQLLKAKKKPSVVRINQSGEIPNLEFLLGWNEVAKLFPQIKFYIYTKAYDTLDIFLDQNRVAENFTILVSIWHEFGIECYKKWCHLDNIKAFVYMDDFDYSKYNIAPTCKCGAYDINGKLSTDEKHKCVNCGLCFLYHKASKIIACYPH